MLVNTTTMSTSNKSTRHGIICKKVLVSILGLMQQALLLLLADDEQAIMGVVQS